MPPSARSDRRDGALALVARRRDLLELQGHADLPAGFLAVYDGDLEETAGSDEIGSLDRLLGRSSVVGVDADLLFGHPGEDARARRYRDNLGQKLASRRVALLSVLRDPESSQKFQEMSVLRQGDSERVTVTCVPASQTIADWQNALSQRGLSVGVVEDEAKGLASLLIGDSDEKSLIGACDLASGRLVELLELATEQSAGISKLRSRWFSLELARRPEARLSEILQECERLQEQEAMTRVLQAWRDAVASMQEDTRALTQLELVVIALRAIEDRDKQLIEPFQDHARIWVMTDTLRVAGDSRTAMLARHVWFDAVGPLLARLNLSNREAGSRGIYAWRSFVCGIAVDAVEIEKIRAEQTQFILESCPEGAELSIERVGAFEPIAEKWSVSGELNSRIEWEKGRAIDVVRQHTSEEKWLHDYRQAGQDLGEKRMKIDRAAFLARRVSSDPAESRDPERVYSKQYWELVQKSPGHLRVFGGARLFRGDESKVLHKRLPEHLREWREDVLAARRQLAREREELEHEAEELDRARVFHVGILWRMLIGSAVAIYAGFLSLNVLRVLLTFQSGAWSTGIWIFIGAIAGGWLGAVLPMSVESRVGRRAAASLRLRLTNIDQAHRQAVQETHEVFRDAEDVRQTSRMTAIHRRTTLLAERAWSIVRGANEAVVRDYERRKLLAEHSGSSGVVDSLAREDAHDWRSNAVIRPEYDKKRDCLGEAEWRDLRTELSDRFNSDWKQSLEHEDPYQTGYLRAAVLQTLVHDLAEMVGEQIEKKLLEQAEAKWGEGGSGIKPEYWKDKMLKAVGLDANYHALLSVRDDSATQRTAGIYRVYRRKSHLAEEICKQIKGARQGFAASEPVVVESNELGGLAMVFHEVPLAWEGLSLSLDESASRDLHDAGNKP